MNICDRMNLCSKCFFLANFKRSPKQVATRQISQRTFSLIFLLFRIALYSSKFFRTLRSLLSDLENGSS